MLMGVEIIGEDEVLQKLEEKFSKTKARKIARSVLNHQGDEMKEAFEAATATYMDTGATFEAVTKQPARITANGMFSKVGFGSHDPERWMLVHLNELGYSPHGVFSGTANAKHSDGTVFFRPRGFGKLQAAYDSHKDQLLQTAQEEIKKELGL